MVHHTHASGFDILGGRSPQRCSDGIQPKPNTIFMVSNFTNAVNKRYKFDDAVDFGIVISFLFMGIIAAEFVRESSNER